MRQPHAQANRRTGRYVSDRLHSAKSSRSLWSHPSTPAQIDLSSRGSSVVIEKAEIFDPRTAELLEKPTPAAVDAHVEACTGGCIREIRRTSLASDGTAEACGLAVGKNAFRSGPATVAVTRRAVIHAPAPDTSRSVNRSVSPIASNRTDVSRR